MRCKERMDILGGAVLHYILWFCGQILLSNEGEKKGLENYGIN